MYGRLVPNFSVGLGWLLINGLGGAGLLNVSRCPTRTEWLPGHIIMGLTADEVKVVVGIQNSGTLGVTCSLDLWQSSRRDED